MIAMTSGHQGCRQIHPALFGCHGGPPAPSAYMALLEYLRKKAIPDALDMTLFFIAQLRLTPTNPEYEIQRLVRQLLG
jgi:hypothetical protein